jgi:hypothetical protein
MQLKFEIHKIIIVNYMFLICCSQFREFSVIFVKFEETLLEFSKGTFFHNVLDGFFN